MNGTPVHAEVLDVTYWTTPAERDIQFKIFDAIKWAGEETSPDSNFLLVTDWRFRYLEVVVDRNKLEAYNVLPDDAVPLVQRWDIDYVVVTRGEYLVGLTRTIIDPSNPDLTTVVESRADLVQFYSESDRFELVYSNEIAYIFKPK